MKTCSSRSRCSGRTSWGQTRIWWGTTASLAVLVCWAMGAWLANNPPPKAEAMPSKSTWYFRSGQWQADLRTVAAIFQYLRAVESAPALPQWEPRPLEVAMPTNSTAAAPRV